MIVGNLVIYLQNSRPANLDILDIIDLQLDLGQQATGSSEPESSSKQSVLEHNLFTALIKIGDWPVVPESVGKADPFAPFFDE